MHAPYIPYTGEDLKAMLMKIGQEVEHDPELVKQAPQRLPVQRVNEVKAGRDLDFVYHPE